MGSSLAADDTDFRIPLAPYYLDNGYWQEILTRRLTLALLVIYSIVLALGIVGHGLVLFILVFYMKKNTNTIWFLNLTAANFVFTCSLPLRITHNALKLHWPFGQALCKLNDSIAYINLYASAYFLMVISIDRCVSTRSSAQAQNLRRNRIACFVALGIWLLALLLSWPRIHFRLTEPSPIDEEVTICFLYYGRSFKQAKINRHIIVISQYIFACLIPISVTIACHLKIAQKQRLEAQQNKSFKVLIAVTAIFYFCWLPYHIFSFFNTHYLEMSKIVIVGVSLTTGLAFASSCINPILYIAMGYDFKERPRPPFLSAFENAFGEESCCRVPETQANPETEMNAQDV
uniref:chemerin-like receptor 1 n=1 Tax=Euleptes europaea TaxID=460621 RepID=UPI0025410FCD|nr:chemerin-like receptor 1 [Euleptes europaea]